MFKNDSYICLEIPEPVATEVMNIRKNQMDEFRMKLPVEITLAGSSGVGVIARDENPAKVFDILNQICSDTQPLLLQFSKVERFTNSDIFVLKCVDEVPLRRLHDRIAKSGIRFEPIKHTLYNPHCTLRSRSPVTNQEHDMLMSIKLDTTFVVDQLSIYVMDQLPMTNIFTCRLNK